MLYLPRIKSAPNGFSLIEVMVVVVIIGLLAVIAIPTFLLAQEQSYASRIANDLRTFSAEFEIYRMQYGVWPEDCQQGEVPSELSKELQKFGQPAITKDTWDWENHAVGVVAGISLYGKNGEESVMIRVDEIIDDGQLSTGRFIENGERYTWIMDW